MVLGNTGRIVHRSRSEPTVTATVPPSKVYNASNVLQSSFGGGSITVSSASEDIVYTRKPKGQRSLSNRCIHTKTSYRYGVSGELPSRRVLNLDAGHSGWYTDYYNGHLLAATAHQTSVANALASIPVNYGSGLLGANGQTFINDAWLKLKPDLTMVNLPNFLWEKKALTGLKDYWHENRNQISKVVTSVKRGKGVAKSLAGGVLGYSFGIAPDISDVRAIIESLTSLRDRIAEFEKSVGSVQHRNTTVFKNVWSTTGTFNNGGDQYAPCYWTVALHQSVVAHFTFVPRPIAALNNVDKFIRGALDSLGFELNPKHIWDAIPFSFLLDWFIPVGQYIENNLKVDALELPVELVDGYLQYSEDISIFSNLRLDVNHVGVSSESGWPGAATTTRRFERMSILPDYSTLKALDVRRPSFKQAELGFALAVQQLGGVAKATASNATSKLPLLAVPFGNLPKGVITR